MHEWKLCMNNSFKKPNKTTIFYFQNEPFESPKFFSVEKCFVDLQMLLVMIPSCLRIYSIFGCFSVSKG
jgi:hypothetical protein